MADNIQILISALLEKTTPEQLEKQLKNIEKKLPKLKLEADLDTEAQIKLHKSLQKIYKDEESQRLKQEQLAQKAMADKEKQLQYEQKVRTAIAQQKQKEIDLDLKANAQREQSELNYWSQRRKESVAQMTSTPSDLQQMKEYYSQLEKTSKQELDAKLKVSNALAQQKQKEEQTNKVIQERIDLFQKEIALKSKSLTSKYGTLVNPDSLKQVNDEALKLTTESFSPEAKSRINQMFKEVEVGAKTSSKALKDGKQDVISFGDELVRNSRKFAEWYLLAGGITGVIDAFKSGISYIIGLDNSLNEIRIVTGKTTEEVTQLALSYNNLAKEMGVTTKEIAETSVDLYRQGLSGSEVEDRMKAIIQYAKISSISLQDSNKIITATANATGESVTKIIDIFAMLGDSTASGKIYAPLFSNK